MREFSQFIKKDLYDYNSYTEESSAVIVDLIEPPSGGGGGFAFAFYSFFYSWCMCNVQDRRSKKLETGNYDRLGLC